MRMQQFWVRRAIAGESDKTTPGESNDSPRFVSPLVALRQSE
jgi:hypothetical protein